MAFSKVGLAGKALLEVANQQLHRISILLLAVCEQFFQLGSVHIGQTPALVTALEYFPGQLAAVVVQSHAEDTCADRGRLTRARGSLSKL